MTTKSDYGIGQRTVLPLLSPAMATQRYLSFMRIHPHDRDAEQFTLIRRTFSAESGEPPLTEYLDSVGEWYPVEGGGPVLPFLEVNGLEAARVFGHDGLRDHQWIKDWTVEL